MSNAWKNYDNWKTSTPYDNDNNPEVFKTEKYDFYSTNEKMVNLFDKEIEKYEYHVITNDYDDRLEYLEESAENLADTYNLQIDQYDAIEYHLENEKSENEYQLECRYEEYREMRRLENE